MKAVGYKTPGPIDRKDALVDIEIDKPEPNTRDLRVAVKAVSVNPADAKARAIAPAPHDGWAILGFDASGVVDAVGSEVANFKPGDEVYYSGSMLRPGTNSEFHLVDERLVGRKPEKISHAEAAALPLTTLTAWEMLFDRLVVTRPTVQGGDVILVIGGAGGVGSITVQLLRKLTDLTIIATASRAETMDWVQELGAHHVINHHDALASQVEALNIGAPGFVFSTNQTALHLPAIAEVIAPQGRFGTIDLAEAFEPGPFFQKAVSLHFELMFTRSMFDTPDMQEQGKLLSEVANLVDAGKITTTMTEVMGNINAINLMEAHRQIETGTARGKIVLEKF